SSAQTAELLAPLRLGLVLLNQVVFTVLIEPASPLEALHHAGDGLAAGADQVGELLVSDRAGGEKVRAAGGGLRGHATQHAARAALDALEEQAAYLLVGLAQAPRQLADQLERDLGVAAQERDEVVAGERQEHAVGRGLDRGGARGAVEQR